MLTLGGFVLSLLLAPGCSRESEEQGLQRSESGQSASAAGAEESATRAPAPTNPPVGVINLPDEPPPISATPIEEVSVASKSGASDDILARIPPAPMGREVGRSALESSPGYRPPEDPEADAVRKGKRDAPRIDRDLDGGASSPELLAMAILDGLREDDRKALQKLRVTRSEFGEIMWPELPSSREITNMDANGAWFWIEGNCIGGLSALTGEFGRRDLRLVEVIYETGLQRYTNFNLVLGVVILALDENDREVRIKHADSFVERDGTWKVFTYKD